MVGAPGCSPVSTPLNPPLAFLHTQQVIDKEFSKYLELRSDKFRDKKKQKHYLEFQKAKL